MRVRPRWSWCLALWLLTGAAEAKDPAVPGWPERLQHEVVSIARKFDGEINLYVKDLSTGQEYGHNALTPAYLASTVKIAVMLEVLRQVDEGKLKLDEVVEFTAADLRDGAGPVKRAAPGTKFPITSLLDSMMGDSDNAATDLLIKRAGLDAINAELARRKLQPWKLTTLLEVRHRVYGELSPAGAALTPRQVFDLWLVKSLDARARALATLVKLQKPLTARDLDGAFDAYYARGWNTAPMIQMGRLVEQIARCEGLSVSSCALAHTLMKACRTGTKRIRAGIPKDAVWAHKTGTQHRRACDVGFLSPSPDRQVVVAMCVRDFRSRPGADRAFAKVGAALWQVLSPPAPRSAAK